MSSSSSTARHPTIVAHRGLHDACPENSLTAFERAARIRCEWAECDIHASSDGVPIVMHDDTLDRTTTASGPVNQLDAAELQRIKLRNSKDCVPALVDICRALGSRCGLLVEIKTPGDMTLIQSTVEVLRKHMRAPWAIQSFDALDLRLTSWVDLSIPITMLAGTADALSEAIFERWPSISSDHRLLDADAVRSIREYGGSVGAWTVNKPADIRRVLRLGIDTLITDDPVLATKIAREFYR